MQFTERDLELKKDCEDLADKYEGLELQVKIGRMVVDKYFDYYKPLIKPKGVPQSITRYRMMSLTDQAIFDDKKKGWKGRDDAGIYYKQISHVETENKSHVEFLKSFWDSKKLKGYLKYDQDKDRRVSINQRLREFV